MTKRLIALALMAALPMAAQAQQYYDDYDWVETYDDYTYVDDYAPSTGDVALDALLAAINARFNDEPVYYAERLAADTRLAPTTLRTYLVERRYAPADVYMMGELAQLSGKSLDVVAGAYDTHRGQGWGAVARSLGIKPGSPQFHQLKRGGDAFVAAQPVSRRGSAPGARRDVPPGHGKNAPRGHGNGKGKQKGKGNGKNR